MKFDVDGLTVLFPYDYIYPEQYNYMQLLKSSLDGNKGQCLVEMPTGTGKTVTLLSLILAYKAANPDRGKLVYCTRTVQEMDKVVDELRRVVNYRDQVLKSEGKASPNILGVCLSSRRNLCVHKRIAEFDNRGRVDALCHEITASFVREQKQSDPSIEVCQYFEGYEREATDATLTGIFALDDMKEIGKERSWCPYFLARRLISLANVVVYNYQYMLDPRISGLVSKEIEKDAIVVFDEAHNIDNVCIEALSVSLDKQTVYSCRRNVKDLDKKVTQLERTNSERLKEEYNKLVQGLSQSGILSSQAGSNNEETTDVLQSSIALPADVIEDALPGNIRKARGFVKFLETFVQYMADRLKGERVTKEEPLTFLNDFQNATQVRQSARALKFSYDRLSSLLRTLQVKNIDTYTPLQMITQFAALAASSRDGFVILFEPYDHQAPGIPDPTIQICCLDSSLAIKPVFENFRTVIITSGTLSPIDMYPKILKFHPKVSESLPMSLSRKCFLPMIVTKGNDQVPITSRYTQREDATVIRNYGQLLIDMCINIPDGIVCFFTSYRYMEDMVSAWEGMGILQQILQRKLIFIETKDIVETTLALNLYKRACDCGRGAIFFSVARGKVAEGVDFNGHYGRAVLLYGIPFQYTLSRVLEARLQYLKKHFNINEGDYLSFDALRQASQCVGRVLRSKNDYGIMVFADVRYSRSSKLNKLPKWITQYIDPSHRSLSHDSAISAVKSFLRDMAQPRLLSDDLGVSLLNEQQLLQRQQQQQ